MVWLIVPLVFFDAGLHVIPLMQWKRWLRPWTDVVCCPDMLKEALQIHGPFRAM